MDCSPLVSVSLMEEFQGNQSYDAWLVGERQASNGRIEEESINRCLNKKIRRLHGFSIHVIQF